MSLWERLFGRKQPSQPPAEVARDITDRFMRLASREFMGQFASSPNGHYRVAWGRDARSSRNSPATNAVGRYILLEGNTVLVDACMTRPEDARVANNGNFIVNDWEDTSTLGGSLVAFDRTGREILRRHFNANLFNNGLSADGRFAACHTCNSYDPDDSSVLAVFDLSAGRELARWYAESGWPNSYEFSEDGKTVGLGCKGLGSFRYSLSGEFIDREVWVEACLAKGEYWTTISMVESLVKAAGNHLPAALASKLLSSLDRIDSQFGSADTQWRPLALRLRGACFEASGANADALACYERALKLNPKIGVKRRADQLRKRQGMAATTGP